MLHFSASARGLLSLPSR